jgi:hypothetical protein
MKKVYITDGTAYLSLRKLCREKRISYWATYYRLKKTGKDEINDILEVERK